MPQERVRRPFYLLDIRGQPTPRHQSDQHELYGQQNHVFQGTQ